MATSHTGQMIINGLKAFPFLAPIFNSSVPGYTGQAPFDILNDTLRHMLGVNFPWKFNEFIVPPFYTNSFQQDYALVDSSGNSITTLAYLMAGDVVDVNNNAQPKANPQVQVVNDLPRTSSWSVQPNFCSPIRFQVCTIPNNQLYFGVWGQANTGFGGQLGTANGSRGNNPQASTPITAPVAGGLSQPNNCINQIQDANGNLLVVLTYGTTGASAPSLPASSAPGTQVTDGSVVWVVLDPLGSGFRVWPVPTQAGVVWQFNLRGQLKPQATITSLSTVINIPDEYIHVFRQGCKALAYSYAVDAKVSSQHAFQMAEWEKALMAGRIQADREPDSHAFVVTGGVIAPVSGSLPISPGNPFGWGS